jgi:hypothetical protein
LGIGYWCLLEISVNFICHRFFFDQTGRFFAGGWANTQPGQAGIEDRRLKIEDLWYSIYFNSLPSSKKQESDYSYINLAQA